MSMADGSASAAQPLTARATVDAVSSGAISAVELAEQCLAHIGANDGEIAAFAHIDEGFLRHQAEALDRRRKAGHPLGPLHGLPVAVKDIIDVQGLPCERGTVLETGRRPVHDAAVAVRLRMAGAMIIGKTVTAELASVGPGKTRNPHDLSRTPGGSSSGSAASVAAGMVPFAIGTQTLGSVIRPGAFCGTFAYKPSFGAIPRTGVMADAPSLDHVGVFARTMDDLALAEHLMGSDGRDPESRLNPGPLTAIATSEPPLKPVFAFVRSPAWDQAEDSTKEAFAELCAAVGATVDEVPLPSVFDRAVEWTGTIMDVEMAHGLGHYVDQDAGSLHPDFVSLVERGRAASAAAYLEARDWQPRLRDGLDAIFDRYDAIITPAAPGEAPGPETTGNGAFCALWSLTGVPALNLPLMTGPAGLPLGVQLVGRFGDDARLLRTARWLVRNLSEEGDTA